MTLDKAKDLALTSLIAGLGGCAIAMLTVGAWGGTMGTKTERNAQDIQALNVKHTQDIQAVTTKHEADVKELRNEEQERLKEILNAMTSLQRAFDRHDARQAAREGR